MSQTEERFHKEKSHPKHGHSCRGGTTTTYRSWRQMLSRCYYAKNDPSFQDYGGRGITVCDRWRDFRNFLTDMGDRPEGFTLDRFPNVNGNYEPGNCRWATMKQQAVNRRSNRLITFNGETKALQTWAEERGLHHRTLWNRLARGWGLDDALNTPTITKVPQDSATGRFV